jgi:signal recognition particle subunit SEC65
MTEELPTRLVAALKKLDITADKARVCVNPDNNTANWRLPRSTGRAVTNESKYPYIVEIAVATDELGVELSRRIIVFHKLRHIELRHGRRIVTPDAFHYRWCFSDLPTARAFIEQFGGSLYQPNR